MNNLIPHGVRDIWLSWHKWLFENLLVLTNLYQLVVVVGLLLLALPLSVWLTRRVVVPRVRAYVPDESELATLERKIDRVVGALVAVVLLGLANLIAEKNQFSHQIISVAFELTLAWMIIRVLTAFLFAEYWAKLMAVIVWTVVALDIAQFLHPIISLLDRVGVTLQGQRLTPWLLIKAGVLLLLFFPLANKLIGFLEGKIKKSEQLKPAVQLLLVKFSKAFLYTLALLVALDTVGIDFQYLLVFSGAVGLGLGLGLQKVVANLVSGYILLMDNSIRPGDVIEVEEVYGWIESLNARYVSVITRDGTAYLVPNEQLMSNMVINWSFSERGLRLKIPVGISYGSDVRRAMELMVEVAAKFPRVLQNPLPVARLIRFGDSSVELELRAWIKDPQRGVVNIKSDIQLSIWDAFHENDIAFPFPQRDLHLKTAPGLTFQVQENPKTD
jgi:small-conductance mechanosensitive channel